jgi:hypothetical protein
MNEDDRWKRSVTIVMSRKIEIQLQVHPFDGFIDQIFLDLRLFHAGDRIDYTPVFWSDLLLWHRW